MEEDENKDDNVWNASAVILDIDSGVLNHGQSQFLELILICHASGV